MGNLPFIGQKLIRRGFRYVPDENGTAKIYKFGDKDRVVFIEPRFGQHIKTYLLPDGTLSRVPLHPFLKYARRLDHFVYHDKGGYRITGEFPNFVTNTGVRVYMDHDRTFWTHPVDFYGRADAWVAQMKRSKPK